MLARATNDRDFRLIPLLLDDELPDLPFLAEVQYADFRASMDYRVAFARLLAGLKGKPPGEALPFTGRLDIPAHPRQPGFKRPPPSWIEALFGAFNGPGAGKAERPYFPCLVPGFPPRRKAARFRIQGPDRSSLGA